MGKRFLPFTPTQLRTHFVLFVSRSCFYVALVDVVQSLADVRTGLHEKYVGLRKRWMAYESQGSDRLMETTQTMEQVLLLTPSICLSQSCSATESAKELLKLRVLMRDSQ